MTLISYALAQSELNDVPSRLQINNPLLNQQLQGLSGGQFAGQFIPMLITLALVVASIIFLFVMILAGIWWMTSGGDKTQIEAARSRVTNALIGLFIVFTVFALITVLEGLFGIKLLTIDLGKLTIQ